MIDQTPIPPVEEKKRKTLDEYIGINGMLLLAIVGAFFMGGNFEALGAVCGMSGVYYLIKKRKEMDRKNKDIGWVLVILWLVLFGFKNSFMRGA